MSVASHISFNYMYVFTKSIDSDQFSVIIIMICQQDYPNDPATLLSPPNRNMDKLHSFAKEVAMATTQNQLPNMQFAVNHHNEEDVAMFDFTSMSMANHSCYVKKRGGKTLLQCIVGDSLLEVNFYGFIYIFGMLKV